MSLMLAALACWWALPYLLPELTLTQKPPRYSLPVGFFEAPLSHVSLSVELPLAELERRLTAEVDASLAQKGKDGDLRVWRSGALRLRIRKSSVHLTLPLSFKSRAGPNTKGSLIVNMQMTADIGPDWQPRARVRSSFDWTKKPRIKLLLIKMRISGVVGRAISHKLRKLDADLQHRIESALTLKPRADAWWQGLHQPEVLTRDPPVWLSVRPQAFYFEPPGGDATHLRLLLGIRAQLATSVAAMPASSSLVPLPPLERALPMDHGFALYLPVTADYKGLVLEMRKKLVGRRIVLEHGAVTPTDFDLYSSGHSLVVGVSFRSDAPGFWFDTRGIAYFTGEPRFDPETRILRIENFQFTRRLNNPMLSTATWVLQESLREAVQNRMEWDMKERLQDGARQLTELLNRPLGNGLQLTGQVDHLNLTAIECRDDGIRIGLEVRGQLKLRLETQQDVLGRAQRRNEQTDPAAGETQPAQGRDRAQPFPAQ